MDLDFFRQQRSVVVIQCAASKVTDAGSFRDPSGRPIKFVAHPDQAPRKGGWSFRPDERAPWRRTAWRSELISYNQGAGNPFGLKAAYQLYAHPVYEELVRTLGIDRVFILSAGWGLVKASFRLPSYDITFKAGVEPYKRRSIHDFYRDFCQLPKDDDAPIIFFGGKDYLPLFYRLTAPLKCKKLVFYGTKQAPNYPGLTMIPFPTSTNWHYKAAREFLEPKLV